MSGDILFAWAVLAIVVFFICLWFVFRGGDAPGGYDPAEDDSSAPEGDILNFRRSQE